MPRCALRMRTRRARWPSRVSCADFVVGNGEASRVLVAISVLEGKAVFYASVTLFSGSMRTQSCAGWPWACTVNKYIKRYITVRIEIDNHSFPYQRTRNLGVYAEFSFFDCS